MQTPQHRKQNQENNKLCKNCGECICLNCNRDKQTLSIVGSPTKKQKILPLQKNQINKIKLQPAKVNKKIPHTFFNMIAFQQLATHIPHICHTGDLCVCVDVCLCPRGYLNKITTTSQPVSQLVSSPQQMNGPPKQTDRRTDVWQLQQLPQTGEQRDSETERRTDNQSNNKHARNTDETTVDMFKDLVKHSVRMLLLLLCGGC